MVREGRGEEREETTAVTAALTTVSARDDALNAAYLHWVCLKDHARALSLLELLMLLVLVLVLVLQVVATLATGTNHLAELARRHLRHRLHPHARRHLLRMLGLPLLDVLRRRHHLHELLRLHVYRRRGLHRARRLYLRLAHRRAGLLRPQLRLRLRRLCVEVLRLLLLVLQRHRHL